MLGQHPTHRFDYLFEPLNDVGADEITDAALPSAPDPEPRRSQAAPNKFVLATVVLAVMAAAAATVVLLLHRPQKPSGQVDAPAEPVQVATTESQVPNPPALVVPPTETDPVTEPPDMTAIVEPPPPEPTAGGQPDARDRPITRAPISVEPTPRELFPNQSPSSGGGQSPSSQAGLPGSPSPSNGHGRGQHR